jgi:hypothetical protein
MDFKKLNPKNKKILAEEVNSPPLKAKLTDHVMVKMTLAEKQKISGLADQECIKMSPLIRQLLKKHGYI